MDAIDQAEMNADTGADPSLASTEALLRASRRREEAIARVSGCVGSTLDLREVLDLTLLEVERAFGPHCCGMRVLPDVAAHLGAAGLCRRGGRSEPVAIDSREVENCPHVEQALASGKVVIASAGAGPPPACCCPLGAIEGRESTTVVAPIRFRSERYGALCLHVLADAWSGVESSVLEAMANQVGLAMRNALSFGQVERAKRRLASTIAHVGVPIICVRADGAVTMWSRAAALTFGHEPSEAEGRPLPELWAQPDVMDAVQQALGEAGGPEGAAFETQATTKSGRRLCLRVNALPEQHQEGQMDEIVLAVQDVTESLRELNLTRTFLCSALDGIQDFISIVDREHRVVFANRAACAQARQALPHVLGATCHRVYWASDAPCVTCLTDKTFDDARSHHAVFEASRPHEAPRWLERWTYPIVDGEGRPEYVIEYCRDVTENREQRRQLGRKVHELRQAYREVASLTSQLMHAERMASIGKMAASLAHQIDSPLSTVFGYASLLSEAVSDERCGEWLAAIKEQAEACRQAVRNLLDFSRKSAFERAEVDVNAIVGRVISLMEYVLRVRNIQVELRLDPALPMAWGNEEELQQLFFNLVGNASDAMPQGGLIEIATATSDDGEDIVARVTDTGLGIAEENMERIFEPFFTTKDRGYGTGLGLAVCEDIARHHGGDISVQSPVERGDGSPACGAEFVVRLPACPGQGGQS